MDYTIETAAAALGVSETHVRNHIRRGQIPADKQLIAGRTRYIISPSALEAERRRIAEEGTGPGKAHGKGRGITIESLRRRAAPGELPLEPAKLARQASYLAAIRAGDVATMRRIMAEMRSERATETERP